MDEIRLEENLRIFSSSWILRRASSLKLFNLSTSRMESVEVFQSYSCCCRVFIMQLNMFTLCDFSEFSNNLTRLSWWRRNLQSKLTSTWKMESARQLTCSLYYTRDEWDIQLQSHVLSDHTRALASKMTKTRRPALYSTRISPSAPRRAPTA